MRNPHRKKKKKGYVWGEVDGEGKLVPQFFSSHKVLINPRLEISFILTVRLKTCTGGKSTCLQKETERQRARINKRPALMTLQLFKLWGKKGVLVLLLF